MKQFVYLSYFLIPDLWDLTGNLGILLIILFIAGWCWFYYLFFLHITISIAILCPQNFLGQVLLVYEGFIFPAVVGPSCINITFSDAFMLLQTYRALKYPSTLLLLFVFLVLNMF